jgi:hypothetical protein
MIGRHLIHRCDIHRYSSTEQGYGKKRVPSIEVTDVPCRLKEKVQRAFNSVTGQWMVDTRYTLQVEFGADLIAGDRVTNVVDEYGQAMLGNYEVAGVHHRRAASLRMKVAELNKVS